MRHRFQSHELNELAPGTKEITTRFESLDNADEPYGVYGPAGYRKPVRSHRQSDPVLWKDPTS
jgi:hypothetical protein